MTGTVALPLKGIKVLDFSTLLPGPLCSLLLAEAGADVVKVERPGQGGEMRSYAPMFSTDSVNFTLLNRGKESITIDLKAHENRALLDDLICRSDVLIEQFRPGVMARLGLGYEKVKKINPRIIYCSITGYGQYGPKAQVAAHDLNYLAESGLLSLTRDRDGSPALPQVLIADIAGGAYPAFINILLALQGRNASGSGCHLDVSMSDNIFPLMYWALGSGLSGNGWPRGEELVTGRSPRYQIYRTSDNRFLAAAPIEDRFWKNFTNAIGASHLQDIRDSDESIRKEVARIIGGNRSEYWMDKFAGHDVCTVLVADLEQAVQNPHFLARGLFNHTVTDRSGKCMPAMPVPICPVLRGQPGDRPAPALGQHNHKLMERSGDQE